MSKSVLTADDPTVRPEADATIALALALAACVLWCVPAIAQRPARKGERRAIAAELGQPTRCVRARVSTVRRKWAAAFSTDRDGCYPGNGVRFLKRRQGGGWRYKGSGPYEGPDQPYCPRVMPKPAARDLGLCS
jgi:hypothetical protein